jgi:lipopolysaccharide exporter
MAESVQRRMAAGALWMVLFKIVERGLGLISTLILARLLSPADFGVVAMALSFIFMAELLTAFGFDIAIIQDRNATREHYDTAWTCNALMGLSITVLMLAAAWPIAHFYRKPELSWVVVALSFGPLLSGIENIGVVAFRKELDFRREFRFQVSRKFLGFIVVVPLAFLLRSYWALVAGILFSKLAGTVISYLMHPFRPRFSLSRVRELFVFSRWLLFNNALGFAKERISDFFIGRVQGPAALGTYNIAYELANLPTTEISAPINRALLPGFAKIETQSETVAAYGMAVGVLSAVALPAAAMIFATAPFLVPVLLGAKWLAAIPLMEILAFNGALLLFQSSMCAVLLGRGFAARVTAANACFVVLQTTLLAVLVVPFGVVGAASAALASSLLCMPVYLYQVRASLGVSPWLFAKAATRPLLAALLAAAAVRWALPTHDPGMGLLTTLPWLAGGMSLGLLVYLASGWCMWHLAGRPAGAEQMVIDRLRAAWTAHLTARAAADKPI